MLTAKKLKPFLFTLTSDLLEEADLRLNFLNDRAGAFNSFEGLVRNHNEGKSVEALEYEADSMLCSKEMQVIFNEVKEKFSVIDARCFHRTGKIRIGEMAVWIGVLSEHRQDSFKACQYIIDQLKIRIPIFKKEYYQDGESSWIGCQQCESHLPSHISYQNYYDRQTSLPEIGLNGQKKLKSAKVLVVGAGGLGCSAITSLANSGIGTIGICEHDKIEESNLSRQFLYQFKDIGQSKSNLATKQIQDTNPFVKINQHEEKLDFSNINKILKGYDYVIDCTDNFPTKFLLNDVCYLNNLPLVQSSVYQLEGQISVYLPQEKGCLRCLWPKIPEKKCTTSCDEAGVLGIIPNIFGHLQALEIVKLILNMGEVLSSCTLIINFKTYEISSLKLTADSSCPLCGINPTIKEIQMSNYGNKDLFQKSISEISIEDIKNYILVDVRESEEVALESLQKIEYMHLPLSSFNELPLSEFSEEKKYLVFCSKGMRSLGFVTALREQGKNNVTALIEGIDDIKKYFKDNDC